MKRHTQGYMPKDGHRRDSSMTDSSVNQAQTEVLVVFRRSEA